MNQDHPRQLDSAGPLVEVQARGSAGDSNGASPAERIAAVGRELSAALRQILDALPDAPARPNELASYLELNRDIAGRVLRAATIANPLQTVNMVPGPEPLRRFTRAAAQRGLDSDIADRALGAIDRFDRLIRSEAGTRAGLNAIISASVPRARERFEVASRQAAFKGMSQLRGVFGELWLSSTIVWPSDEDPMHHDVVMVHGALGMQRLRPDAMVKFTYRDVVTAPAESETDVTAETHRDAAPLAQFCTNPPAELETRRIGQVSHHILRNNGVGPQSAVDMLAVDHHPAAWDRYADPNPPTPGRTRKSVFVAPGIPAQNLLFDAILHEDVFPGSEPELVVYDTTTDGIAWINDPARDLDRLTVDETIEFLGRDIRRFDAAEIPNYQPMLLHLCDRYGCDPAGFRGYRCRMAYPVHGWQVCMAFEPPVLSE